MTAATATPPLTAGARADAIKANAERLLQRMPAGWEAWSVDRTRNFKRLVNDVRRAKSLLQTQSAAGQLAAVYKVTPFELDPWGAS